MTALWFGDPDRADEYVETGELSVEYEEPPEVGRLLGPDGELAAIVRAPILPLGFRPGGMP